MFLRNQRFKGVELKIPARLSYDYVQMLSYEKEKSFEMCRIYKSITLSMIKIIKEHQNISAHLDDYRVTDKGNQIIHVSSAFSDDIIMKSNIDNSKHLFNCKNMNGWTPIFFSNFKNNEIMIKHLSDHVIDQSIEDYFGNTASFYAKH